MDPFLPAFRVMVNSRKLGTGKVEMGREIEGMRRYAHAI